MLDFGFGTLGERSYPAGTEIPAHTHETSKVSFLVTGSLEECAGRRSYQCGPLQVVAKPAGVEHSDRVGPQGARVFTVWYSRESLEEIGLCPPDEYRWWLGGEPVRAAIAMLSEVRASQGSSDEGPLRMLAALDSKRPAGSERARPGWLDRVRDLLHAEFADPLRVSVVARRVDVHPVHLSRVFQRVFGCSVSDYVRRLRVQRAMDEIRHGQSLAGIAANLGFADQPHFSRVFRGVTGITPGRWRQLQR